MTRFAIVLLAGVSAVSLASAVQAADLIINEPVEAGVVSMSGDWDGAYIGAFVGAGWANFTDDLTPALDLDASGWLVGGTIGANFTVGGGIVAGVVADLAWADITGEDTAAATTYSVDWQGSLRGRLGFDGGAFLPYLTGGLAVAGVSIDDGIDDETNTHIGWTVGAGIEFAVTQDLSIDALYRYSDYGSQDYVDATTAAVGLTSHTVQVGLNWHF